MHAAFVASASLKPMARQLLQDRTPAAYAGVEAYARRHAQEDAGALAWLVLGYAHILDKDYAKAVDPLSRAKPQAGDLGDYVNFYLGTAYFQSGKTAEAVATLADFEKKYPDSLLLRDARVLYGSALLAENRAKDAIAVLEKDRQPPRADLELALGRAYAAAGQPAKAAEILRNLYITMPLSAEAGQADVELKKLASTTQLPPLGLNGRRTRADLLAKGKRFSDAADEYRDLLSVASPSDRPDIQMALAIGLAPLGAGQGGKEGSGCAGQLAAPDIKTQRLYNLGEIARSSNDEDGFLRYLAQLRQSAPTSLWLQQALLSAGNFYLLKPDYDKAIDAYRELQQRFPNAGRASYAHWKVAWLSLRQGRNAEAKTGFEQQIALYPDFGGGSCGAVLAGPPGGRRQRPGHGARVLPEAFGTLPQFLLRRTGAPPLARNSSPTTIRRSYALLDRVPGDQRRDQHHDHRSADRQPALSEGASAGERRRCWTLRCRELQAAATEDTGELAGGRDCEALRRRGTLRRSDSGFQTRRAQLFRGGSAHAAASLLGGAVSQALLARPEEIFVAERAGSRIWWRR